jgi:hypothetical protein
MAMEEDIRIARGLEVGRRFIDAIVTHDWQSMADCFEPEAHFRAVVPNKNPFRDHVGGDAAADQLRRWFGDADVTELMASSVEPMEDRFHLTYRIHEHEPDGWYVVEQQAYITLGEQAIVFMNLLCSGFRPVPA